MSTSGSETFLEDEEDDALKGVIVQKKKKKKFSSKGLKIKSFIPFPKVFGKKKKKPKSKPNLTISTVFSLSSEDEYGDEHPKYRQKKYRYDEMVGKACEECEKFYKDLGSILSEKDIKEIETTCSRHRYRNESDKKKRKFSKYDEVPKTPEGYWDLGFFKSGDEEK